MHSLYTDISTNFMLHSFHCSSSLYYNTTSPSRNHRLSRFPGRSCKSMEQSTIKFDIIVKFESFQVSLENWVVYVMLMMSWLTLTYCAHLSHAHWLYVTCPWSYYYYYYYYIENSESASRVHETNFSFDVLFIKYLLKLISFCKL